MSDPYDITEPSSSFFLLITKLSLCTFPKKKRKRVSSCSTERTLDRKIILEASDAKSEACWLFTSSRSSVRTTPLSAAGVTVSQQEAVVSLMPVDLTENTQDTSRKSILEWIEPSGLKDVNLRGVTIPGSRGLQVKASLYMCFLFGSADLKVLGMWFRGAGECAKTWEERIAKVRQKLGIWEYHSLSIVGKNLAI
eukprot:g34226.t1